MNQLNGKIKPPKVSIFIDESGKPEVFSAHGTNLVESGTASRFLVLAAVRHHEPLALQKQIFDFKSALLADKELTKIFSPAYSLDSFHAQSDYPAVKERFFSFINMLDIKINVIVIEKLKCFEPLQRDPSRMYAIMAGQLLQNICHTAERTEVVFSRKDSKLKLRKELEIEVERMRLEFMESHPALRDGVSLAYFHNPHYSHGGLQVADYIAHAVFQVFERGNRKWYEMIKGKMGQIADICNKKYFTRSNPL